MLPGYKETQSKPISAVRFELNDSCLKEGLLLRKHIIQQDTFIPMKYTHRQWKSYYTMVDPKGELHFYKFNPSTQKNQQDMARMLIIRHAVAEKINVYKKRPILNQFKLTLHNGSIYYFQVGLWKSFESEFPGEEEEETNTWIRSINYVAARRTVIPLSLAIGSNTKEFMHPKLPLIMNELNEVSQNHIHHRTSPFKPFL